MSNNAVHHPETLADWFQAAGQPLPETADPELKISGATDDSRAVAPGHVFLAVPGETVDGHDYIARALDAGAALVLAERIPDEVPASLRPRIALLPDCRRALPLLAHAWWGNPSRHLCCIGITGTNGKTTTAYLVHGMLEQLGLRPALLSTVEYRVAGEILPAPNTTPGAFRTAQLMAAALEQGQDAFIMEVSSHALVQRRADAIHFDAAIMTNLTQDHLDYHKDMQAYADAKQLLFTRLQPTHAIFNLDDSTSRRFSSEHQGHQIRYALDESRQPDLCAEGLQSDKDGLSIQLALADDPERALPELRSPLRGRYNASNLLAAAATGIALGHKPDHVIRALRQIPGAPGRFEAIDEGQPFAVFVDYAHTPDALERILENIRAITLGRLIVVAGCGGDRDNTKRPIMGAAMARLADYSIITNDNPRTEDPAKIARQMEAGLLQAKFHHDYRIELDRAAAIRQAIAMAQPNDSVLIAGKGHEDYQESNGQRRHFDDREQVRLALNELASKA